MSQPVFRLSRREALAIGGMGLLGPLVQQQRSFAAGVSVPRCLFIYNGMGFGLEAAATKLTNVDAVESSDFTCTGMFAPLNAIKKKVLLLENVTGKWYRTGSGHHTNTLLTGWAPPTDNSAPLNQSLDYFLDNYLKSKFGQRMFGFVQSPGGMGIKLSLMKFFEPLRPTFSFQEGGQSLRQEIVPNNFYRRMVAAMGQQMMPKPQENPEDVARRVVYDALLKDLKGFKERGRLGAAEAAKLEAQISGLTGAAAPAGGGSVPAGSLPASETLPNALADDVYKGCMDWNSLVKDRLIFRKAQQNHFALARMAVQYGFAHVGVLDTGLDHGEINNGNVTRLVASEVLDNIKNNVDRARADGVVESHNMVSHYDLEEGPNGYLSSQAWGGSIGNHEPAKRAHRVMQTNVIGRVAALAQQLDAVTEANGTTALDNTLIFLFSDMADGNHQIQGMKYVLIGGKSLGIRQGRYVTYPNGPHGSAVQEPDVLRDIANAVIKATGGTAAELKKTWGDPALNNLGFDTRIKA